MKLKKPNAIVLSIFVVTASISALSLMALSSLRHTPAEIKPRELECQEIRGFKGVEDMTLTSNGTVLIASQDRDSQIYQSKWLDGEIYALEPITLDTNEINARKIAGYPPGMQAVAMSIFEHDGRSSLFVLSYDDSGYVVLKFSWDGKTLQHLASNRGDDLITPIAIVAINHQEYLVLNSQGLYTPSGRMLEAIFSLNLSHLVHFDGQGFKKLAHRFRRGFGLAFDHATQNLIVSDIEAKTISFLKIKSQEAHQVVHLPSHPARLFLDQQKRLLWIAAQPDLRQARAYAANPRPAFAPSQVLTIPLSNDNQSPVEAEEPQSPYLSEGKSLSACTSLVKIEDHVLIGSPYMAQILSCKVPQYNDRLAAPRVYQTTKKKVED